MLFELGAFIDIWTQWPNQRLLKIGETQIWVRPNGYLTEVVSFDTHSWNSEPPSSKTFRHIRKGPDIPQITPFWTSVISNPQIIGCVSQKEQICSWSPRKELRAQTTYLFVKLGSRRYGPVLSAAWGRELEDD